MQTAKQHSKQKRQRMSCASREAKELSTKEDKIINSTLFLLEDNKLKLDIVNKLNKVGLTIEGLEFDEKTRLDLWKNREQG